MTNKTEEDRRKEFALKQYETYRQRENSRVKLSEPQPEMQRDSRVMSVRPNPELYQVKSRPGELSEEYKRYIMQNSSNKFHKDIPIVRQHP